MSAAGGGPADADEARASLRAALRGLGAEIERDLASPGSDDRRLREAQWRRACIHWFIGEYERSWRQSGRLLEAERGAPPSPDGCGAASAAGQPLVVDATDGGDGDLIQNVRFVREARDAAGGELAVLAPPGLLRLFAHSIDGVRWLEAGPGAPAGRHHVELRHLPVVLRKRHAELGGYVPYLRAEVELSRRWRARLARTPWPRVGLTWSHQPLGERADARSIPLPSLAPLLSLSGPTFVSLQKGGRDREIAGCGLTGRLLDFGDRLVDYADTAALIANLDLVVSRDTGVAHLAGAMGKPTWVLLRRVRYAAFHMLDDASTPWYPSMTLRRQAREGDWDGLAADVARRLQAWAREPAARCARMM